MLDLQASIHFQEVEGLVGTDDELDGTGALILHRLGQRHGLLTHGFADAVVDEGRRGFLDDFLVPSLNRTLAFEQIDGVAKGVGDELDFDMVRSLDKLLDEHAIVAKAVARLVAAGVKAFGGLLVVVGDAQSLAATTGRGLDHDRVTDILGDADGGGGIFDGRVVAGDGVDLGFFSQLLRGNLVAHGGDRMVLRADEDDAAFFETTRELLVLGEEAVARVHRLGAGLFAGGDDLVHHQIRFLGRCRADTHGFVGHQHVHRVLVGFGIDGDRLDTHLLGGLHDPAGNFAAVGDQYFLEHLYFSPWIKAECCRACATGFPVSCPAAWPASGKCACGSRAA
jgi:hypothetical protein